VERHDGWAEVILNRPQRKNAVTQPLAAALRDAFLDVAGDDTLRVIVLRGEGGAFCSGLDLKELNADPPPAWAAELQPTWRDAHVALFECPQVVIGALERYAINAGAALALGCDLLVAGEDSYLHVGEVQQGMSAPMNLAWLAARYSENVAARLALTGKRAMGPELVNLGIAMSCVPETEVLSAAQKLAEELAAYPGAGLRNTKAALRTIRGIGDGRAWFDAAAKAVPLRVGGGIPRVKQT